MKKYAYLGTDKQTKFGCVSQEKHGYILSKVIVEDSRAIERYNIKQ